MVLPDRLVESMIAVSVAYVAADNLWGRRHGRRWLLAFGFGLVHGLGFYSALSALDLGGAGVVTTLLAFNLGVEVGQLAVVPRSRRPWGSIPRPSGSRSPSWSGKACSP